MKDYIAQPDRLVNVKGLDKTIAKAADGGLRIGAAVTIADLAANADVARMYPGISQAAAEVGTPQIRNAGTVGGNINQRPRCWYFRNEEFNCLKKGGSRCFAVDGENQYHAIFGPGPCHIVHPSSLAVPSLALAARMRVVGPAGEREIPADQYFVMPDRNLFGETEVRYKQSHDWPIASASVALDLNGRTVRGARVVMGAVAPIPWRAEAAERVLAGKAITEQTAMEAADAAVQGAKAMSQNAYKIQVARTAVKRAIMLAAGLKGNWA
jgi:xanthine dehydrogenase YagS FAD-binding subunit